MVVSNAQTVVAALLYDPAVSAIITNQIFPDQPPTEAAFPCLCYSESQTPALSADNAEAMTSVVFVLEAYRKSSAWPLAIAADAVMVSLGYVRNYTQDAGMAGSVHQVSMKYSQIKEG